MFRRHSLKSFLTWMAAAPGIALSTNRWCPLWCKNSTSMFFVGLGDYDLVDRRVLRRSGQAGSPRCADFPICGPRKGSKHVPRSWTNWFCARSLRYLPEIPLMACGFLMSSLWARKACTKDLGSLLISPPYPPQNTATKVSFLHFNMLVYCPEDQ